MTDPSEPADPTGKAVRSSSKKPRADRLDEPSDGSGRTGAEGQADVATYELARDELAAVVGRLESGGLSLDESLSLWERGEHLAAVCNRFLEGARERVDTALARADEKG